MFSFNRFSLRLASSSLVFALSACSFSHSSDSSSDSSNSISDSSNSISNSSSSFSGGGAKYEADVADYTYAYLKSTSSPPDYQDYLRGLSDIAKKRGISDWEDDAHTYKGIGKALKKAGIDGVGYETYKTNFAGSDPSKMQEIQQGYDSRD